MKSPRLRSALRRALPALTASALAAAALAAGGAAPAAASVTGAATAQHAAAAPRDATTAQGTAADYGLSRSQAQDRAKQTGRPVTVTSLTTPTSTTTANPDGSFTLDQTLQPVRAWRNGAWVPLDPTLHANQDGTVTPAVTTAGLVLSGGGAGPLAVLANGGRTLSLSWPGRLPAPALSGATATYHNVLPGVDLTVTATSQGGFTDVLAVRNAAAAASPALRSLTLAASAPGLNLTATPDGGMSVAASAKAAPVFSAPAPQMWDSTPLPAGTATTTTPDGTVTAKSGLPATSTIAAPGAAAHTAAVPLTISGNTIALAPPAAALTGPGVSYPVFIDPTVYPDPISASAQDWTQVDKGFPSQSYWNESSELQVGYCGFAGCNGLGVARSFVRFPISSDLYGATINYSYFYSSDVWAPSCSATAAQLWTTGPISSSTTWNNQPSWNTEVQQKSFAFGYSSSCAWYKDDVTWTITSIMQRDADQAYTSQHFGIRAADETNDLQWKQFHSGSSYLHLSTKYNLPPEKPTSRSTNPGGNCVYSASGAPVIGNDDVTFSGYVFDHDGDNSLTTRFFILNSSGSTVYDSSAKGTSVKTGDGATASLTLTRSVMQSLSANGSTTANTYHWYARTTDGSGLTSAMPADECYFTYNPKGPSAPTISPNPITGQLGRAVPVSFAPSAPNCGGTSTSPCPASYTYQLGASIPVTLPADSSGNWSGNIPLRRAGPMLLSVYATDAAGNVSESATVSVSVTPPATPYADGDINGDGEADLLTVGTSSKPGLWLATGSGPGKLHRPVQIGGAGTGLNTSGTPADWAGAIPLHGDFTGDGVQDIMAYYPTGTHAGAGQLVGGTGDGSPLQPYVGNTWNIPSVALIDPFFANPNDFPVSLVAAGDASQIPTNGHDDLIGVLGDPASGYELDLFNIASGSNTIAGYGWDTTLSTQAPDGTSDWNNYQLAAAQPGGNPTSTVLFALDTATGALYESTNPTSDPVALIGTPGTWTQITVPWGTTPPTLTSADINAAGQTELWTTSGTTATPYVLSGTTLTAETGTTLTRPSHEYPIAEGTGTTASDTTGTIDATVAGTPVWTDPDSGDIFAPALGLDGTTNYLAASGPAVTTTSSYTVSAWVKLNLAPGTTALPTHNQAVAAQDGTNDSAFYLDYNYAAGGIWTLALPTSDITSPGWNTAAAGPPAVAGIWTHLVGIYNASTKIASLYVNGALAGTASISSTWSATGPFSIGRSKFNGHTADLLNGTVADVQTWQSALTTAQVAATGGVTGLGPVQSAISGKCLDDWRDANTNANKIDIYTCNNGHAQNWATSPSPAAGDTIQINGKCLDDTSSGTTNGTLVQLYTCNNTAAQQWAPGPNGSLVNTASGKCLDDPGSTTTDGTQLQIYTCNGSDAQNWTLP